MRNGLVVVAIVLGLAASPPIFPAAALRSPADRKDSILKLFVDELVTLTPGQGKYPASFRMGSAGRAPENEQPALKVSFKRQLAMAKHEVTQELYELVMGKNPSRWKGPRNSVEMVSWAEANEFCRRLTSLLRERKLLGKEEIIRLPSEAEWEYACRAGTTTAFSFGDAVAELKHHAWYKDNSKGEDPPVGKKRPNPWGFHDMHGYVWEWCADAWHPGYKGAPSDGSAWGGKEAKERVIRGGSWKDGPNDCRSAARRPLAFNARDDAVGFRCVRAREIVPKEKGARE
jgi:formylglycine-generating enzyme required for sulfatase activity